MPICLDGKFDSQRAARRTLEILDFHATISLSISWWMFCSGLSLLRTRIDMLPLRSGSWGWSAWKVESFCSSAWRVWRGSSRFCFESTRTVMFSCRFFFRFWAGVLSWLFERAVFLEVGFELLTFSNWSNSISFKYGECAKYQSTSELLEFNNLYNSSFHLKWKA